MKKTGLAPGLMDFKHGTTTLGFVFQGGIIIAVDSRASMGAPSPPSARAWDRRVVGPRPG